LVPRVWCHRMHDYLKWGSEHKVKYYYAELYPNWGEGPKPWIMGKLLWNPSYDVDSLLNVWYISFAGKNAAPKLKSFYQIWEQFWSKDIFKSSWNYDTHQYLNFTVLSYLSAVPKEYVANCDKLMNDAFNLTNKHSVKASYIDDSLMNISNNVHGEFFKVEGNVATANQFFLTDSTKNFLRGALYFDATPNEDSLRPINQFLVEDMKHLISTLRWK